MTVLSGDDLVAAARRLGPDLVRRAAEVERAGVGEADLARLADAGLFGLYVPPEFGGAGESAAQARQVAETLAGADPQVWFVWFQHAPVVRALVRSANTALAATWLPRLASGKDRAGVAYSHLRGEAPAIRAVRDGDGWRLTGRQPWCTGWGLISAVLVGALTESGEALFAIVDPAAAGLRPSPPLALAAMGATSTVSLDLDGVVVRPDRVTALTPYPQWREADRAGNANVQPSTFGVAAAAIALLAPSAPGLAERLAGEVDAVRREAYRLLDEVEPELQVERRLALRARALVLATQAATAVVVARGGRALAGGDPGGRLLQAAAFQLVHSQDAPVRAATFGELETAVGR